MNYIYNGGAAFSDPQLPSNLLGLCIHHNWLDETLDVGIYTYKIPARTYWSTLLTLDVFNIDWCWALYSI